MSSEILCTTRRKSCTLPWYDFDNTTAFVACCITTQSIVTLLPPPRTDPDCTNSALLTGATRKYPDNRMSFFNTSVTCPAMAASPPKPDTPNERRPLATSTCAFALGTPHQTSTTAVNTRNEQTVARASRVENSESIFLPLQSEIHGNIGKVATQTFRQRIEARHTVRRRHRRVVHQFIPRRMLQANALNPPVACDMQDKGRDQFLVVTDRLPRLFPGFIHAVMDLHVIRPERRTFADTPGDAIGRSVRRAKPSVFRFTGAATCWPVVAARRAAFGGR